MFPGLFLIIFLGSLATYTSYLLIQFKLNHPHVHSMGDAGQLLFGRVGREVLSFGTICLYVKSLCRYLAMLSVLKGYNTEPLERKRRQLKMILMC